MHKSQALTRREQNTLGRDRTEIRHLAQQKECVLLLNGLNDHIATQLSERARHHYVQERRNKTTYEIAYRNDSIPRDLAGSYFMRVVSDRIIHKVTTRLRRSKVPVHYVQLKHRWRADLRAVEFTLVVFLR